MELLNHTRYPAGIARMVIGQDDRIAASVLVRVTYDVRGAALVAGEAQPWIFSQTPWEGPRGAMDSDLVFYKGGVDVFLFGNAVAPARSRTSEMAVVVRVGENFERRVRVFGPRVWQRRAVGLTATSPRPFSTVPLTLSQAFGGKDTWDGLEIPWPENPDGQGFYQSEDTAVDRPLPCIEEPEHLITRWDDRPPSAGLGPLPVGSSLRSKQGLVLGPDGQPKITARLFNAAFAPMIAAEAKPGDAVTVSGVSAEGLLGFTLPPCPFFVRLRFGSEVHELPLTIDQIGILADEQRAFIAYRCPFRYIVHALQERACELFERG
jgi:hypothetical protein